MLPPPAIRGIFRTDERARAAYAEGAGIYRILPAAVCLPADRADLVALVRWAGSHHVPLVPRGAGSAMGGGNVGEGVIVDLTRLERRLEVRASERIAVTSANVTLAELNAAADAHHLRLPPDPSSGRFATLGGMVSTNASGARTVRFGSVRRWVRAVELVTAAGEVVELRRGGGHGDQSAETIRRFATDVAPALRDAHGLIAGRFPRTRKNSAGYALDEWLASGDLLDLVVGAEGTLGFITRVEWLLDPQPSHRAGLRIELRSLDDLVKVVAALHPCEPSAVELLDRTFLDLVSRTEIGAGLDGVEAMLLVEIERDDATTLRRAVAMAANVVQPWAAAVDTALTPESATRLWELRHAASPILASLPEDRRSLQVIEDACLPIDRMGEYIRTVRRVTSTRDIAAVIFGHAGDGHVHVNLLPAVGRAGLGAERGGRAGGSVRRGAASRRNALRRARRRPAAGRAPAAGVWRRDPRPVPPSQAGDGPARHPGPRRHPSVRRAGHHPPQGRPPRNRHPRRHRPRAPRDRAQGRLRPLQVGAGVSYEL